MGSPKNPSSDGKNSKGFEIFKSVVSPGDGEAISSLYKLFKTAIGIVTFVLLVDLFILSKGSVSAGEFGDFFGGVLNPFLTFITFMGLLITIILQQSELSESRKELKRSADALLKQNATIEQQKYESTFFNAMSLRADLVQSIDLTSSAGNAITGRDCFVEFENKLRTCYRLRPSAQNADIAFDGRFISEFWEEVDNELAHYFRSMLALFSILDAGPSNKEFYSTILKAQLSNEELLLLFYFCMSDLPGSDRMRKYVTKHSVLSDLPVQKLFEDSHISIFREEYLC